MVSSIGKEMGANVGELIEAAQAAKAAKAAKAANIGKKALADTGKDILSLNVINAAKKRGISLEKIQAYIAKRQAALKYDSCIQTAYRNQVAAQAHNKVARTAVETTTGAMGWIKDKSGAVINAAKKHPIAAIAIALAAVGLGYLAFKKPAEEKTLKEAA